jgi:ATP/maltotriose-dependent transcriptional regulator MalT/DNA-binding SARP family transcriptional activator
MGCAWYTAGPGDQSVTNLARGLARAFRRRLPALRGDLEAVMGVGERDDRGQPELLAGLICEALEPIVSSDLPLIVDSAEQLEAGGPSGRLLEALTRQSPPALHLVIASRTALPAALGRPNGDALALGPGDLAFSIEETETLIASTLGRIDAQTLETIHAQTGGWPAAARLAVETLQSDPQALSRSGLETLVSSFGEPFSTLADEAFSREPPEVLELLSRMSPFDRLTPDLCVALGIEDADAILDSLAQRGLFVQYQGGAEPWLTLHVLLREYAQDRWPLPPEERREILLAASEWLAAHGHLDDALGALDRTGDLPAVARFLVRHGHGLLAAGGGGHVLDSGEAIPPELRDPELETLLGWVGRLRGDWTKAFDHYRRAAARRGALSAPLAWRMVEAHYLLGELRQAVEVAARAVVSDSAPHDRAMLMAWEASAHHRLGDNERALEMARAARELAESANDHEAMAAAHTTEAMVVLLAGGNDSIREAHEAAAMEAAERSGSLHARVRILVNRSDHLTNQGRFAEVREMTDAALRLAESSGDPFAIARVLDVRAQAALGQGHLAEAINDAEAAGELYQRAGSHMAFEAILILGHAHREAGQLAAARVAFEDGLGIGERTSNVGVIQEALAALSRLTVVEDPAQARRLAERALGIEGGTQHSRTQAMLGAGWVMLASGERARARSLSEQAARLAVAHERRRLPRLAESLELAAMAGGEPDLITLERALEVWREVGNEVAIARVALALATLGTGPSDERPSRAVALRRLQALGVRPSAAARAAGLLAMLPGAQIPPVEVRTLGGFAVLREGISVSFSEWKSRKARDLLKMLVARRGRPTHREFLMETLWPEEPPERLSNRLSVALAILRSVLDPGRAFDSQHFVTGEADSVRLNRDLLVIDVEAFLQASRRALAKMAGPDGPVVELETAEALYTGDFLEEDPYEDWAAPLREEAKSLYTELCRRLAATALRAGRHDEAINYGLKILARDPFDEPGHLLIVRALASTGRHGEARRRYGLYVGALEELGVTPSAYPATSAA